MWLDNNYHLVLWILLGVSYIFLGITERYYSSELRREESHEISRYYLYFGGFFLIIPFLSVSISILDNLNTPYPDLTFLIPIFIMLSYLLLLFYKTSPSEVNKLKKLKLADELYLDRVEKLNLIDLLLNRYRVTAYLIKKHGKEKTAAFYSALIFLLLIILVYFLYIFSPIEYIWFYVITFILLSVLIVVGNRMSVKRYGKAAELASSWDD